MREEDILLQSKTKWQGKCNWKNKHSYFSVLLNKNAFSALFFPKYLMLTTHKMEKKHKRRKTKVNGLMNTRTKHGKTKWSIATELLFWEGNKMHQCAFDKRILFHFIPFVCSLCLTICHIVAAVFNLFRPYILNRIRKYGCRWWSKGNEHSKKRYGMNSKSSEWSDEM